MRYPRVLLVNPPYTGARVRAVFSAGLGYIAEALEDSGVVYDVFDMSLGRGYLQLQKKIKNFRPSLVGISMMTYRYTQTYALLEAIKKDNPELPIVAGGPHVSLFRQQVLTDCSPIDFGVVMEGERTIVELCTGGAPEHISGLLFRDGGRIVYTGDRPFISDLDALSFPRYQWFALEAAIDKRMNALPIVSSRGCPFTCVYCPVQYSIGQTFRARSPGNIMSELAYWHDRGYRRFSFADDNFTLIKERVYALCEAIKKSKLKDLYLSCDNGVRADKLDYDLLRLMKEVGFFRIALGVEAGNNKVLKNLRKQESIETIKEAIAHACALGYEVDLFFLVGSPGETWDDLEDSFRLAMEYPIGTAYFYNIIPFPQTELFNWVKQHGRFLKSPAVYLDKYPVLDNDPVFETREMPASLRRQALARAFQIMRGSMYRSWSRRLSHYGFLGKLCAFLYTTRFAQDVLLRQKFYRKIVYGLVRKFIH